MAITQLLSDNATQRVVIEASHGMFPKNFTYPEGSIKTAIDSKKDILTTGASVITTDIYINLGWYILDFVLLIPAGIGTGTKIKVGYIDSDDELISEYTILATEARLQLNMVKFFTTEASAKRVIISADDALEGDLSMMLTYLQIF